MDNDAQTSKEIALVRTEIKTDINGLRELMSSRFAELTDKIETSTKTTNDQIKELRKRVGVHDNDIDKLSAWQNWVNGSARTVIAIAVIIGAIYSILSAL